jgi:hypothetical protein
MVELERARLQAASPGSLTEVYIYLLVFNMLRNIYFKPEDLRMHAIWREYLDFTRDFRDSDFNTVLRSTPSVLSALTNKIPGHIALCAVQYDLGANRTLAALPGLLLSTIGQEEKLFKASMCLDIMLRGKDQQKEDLAVTLME